MKAVMYGAGNIGRGFIGPLFSQSGYQVTFVDVAAQIVDNLHSNRRYPVRIVADDGFEDMTITNVDAIDGNDGDKVAQEIAEADIMATAVGVNILPHIAPNIAAGITKRFSCTDRPLNILICENLMDANKVLERLLKECLPPEEHPLFDRRIGLVEASIGRMVPLQTPAMQDGDPMRVCVERYGFLPVDKSAFVGVIPAVKNMIPYSPFDFYLKRKLYIHNMGHCVCAYLGLLMGEKFIWQAIDDPELLLMVKNAMLESGAALSCEYGASLGDIFNHIEDLLARFANRALMDTCARVGQDPARKLSPVDRLIGAARLCAGQGVIPANIAVGTAAGIYRLLFAANQPQSAQNALGVLEEISGLSKEDPFTLLVMEAYELMRRGTNAKQLRKWAGGKKNGGERII